MEVFRWPGEKAPPLDCSVATLGVFDGVHLGHQKVLAEVVEAARRCGAVPVVLTFDRHPRQVLQGPQQPCITSLEHRVRLFEHLGLEVCLVIRFGVRVAAMRAAEFARTVFRDLLKARLLVVGPDCRFGRGGEGGVELCREMSAELGLAVQQVPPVSVGGEVVSSTAIRSAVHAAELERAAALLGRPFSLLGKVVAGAGRGRELGYPTLNLDVSSELVPRQGVYAGRVWSGRRWRPCVTSVGTRETFAWGRTDSSVVEVHVMDARLDLCGEDLEVQFARWLRPQRRFATAEALVEQIARDVEQARRVLSAHGEHA